MSMKVCRLAILAAAAIYPAAAQTTPVPAPATRTFTSPVISIAGSESLLVTVVNHAANSSTGTAASCSGSISFVNNSGAAITSNPAPASFTLASGATSSASLAFAQAGASGSRAAVRAQVTLNVPSSTPRPPCSLDIAEQIVDTATGVTHAYIGAAGLSTGGRF